MDVTIRRARAEDADACAAIHVAAWDAAYRGIMPDEAFDERPLERRRRQWRDWIAKGEEITLVACDAGGEIVGFAGGRTLHPKTNGFDSCLALLYLRPDVKGLGIGKRLITAFASEMRGLGANSMVLRTLRLNPARTFYERLGARLVPEGVDIDAGAFDDVVYAFDDLRSLLGVDL